MINIEIPMILENKEILKKYILIIINPNTAKIRPNLHLEKLKHNDASAILCDNIINSYNISLYELRYIIDNDLTSINRNCITCGKLLKSLYRQYCSSICAGSSVLVKEKRKQTCIENFGVEHNMKSPEIIEICKQKYMEKYGVTSPFKDIAVKEKKKKTCMERYGVEYSLQSKEVKEKKKKTCMEKYGVDSYSKTEESRKATSERMKKQRAADNTEPMCCPHCGKIGFASGMRRWHFDHCKDKQ